MHSIYYNYSPSSFTGTWTTHAQLNPELNLRNANDLHLPFPRIELYKKMPLYSLALAWNKLGDLRFQHNRFTFKTALLEMLQPSDLLLPALNHLNELSLSLRYPGALCAEGVKTRALR